MARPDLKDGYSGWQAVDATPQETSDGVSLVTFTEDLIDLVWNAYKTKALREFMYTFEKHMSAYDRDIVHCPYTPLSQNMG